MNGVQFGNKHSFDDWDLILTKKTIGLPTPKVSSVDVNGADGTIDISEVLAGEIKFNNRVLKFEFTMTTDYEEYNELITLVANHLHGRKLKIVLDDDNLYYYYGRCYINEWGSDKRIGKIVIECECEPYKYDLRQNIVTANINGSTYVKLYGKRMTVTPIINVSNDMKLVLDGEEIDLLAGNNEILDLFIKEGVNSLLFKGNGTVKITFTGGEL